MKKLKLLSAKQYADWLQNGYLILPDFVDPEKCTELKQHADSLVQQLQPEWQAAIFSTHNQATTTNAYFLNSANRISIFMEEEAPELPNKLGHALHDLDPIFADLCRSTHMKALAADLDFVSPLLLQSMLIFKHPGFGGEVKAHQDSTFLNTQPGSVVGFWLALDDAHRENGCLWAIPGGHHEALRSQMIRTANGEIEFKELDPSPLPTAGYVPIEVPRGALVLLHGLLPHKSESNRSAQSRYAFTLHVIEGTAKYGSENWLQREPSLPLRGFE